HHLIGTSPSPDPAAESPGWRASLVPGKGPKPWPHVLDRLKSLPLQVQAPDEFTSMAFDGGRVVYIRSTGLSPYTGEMTVMSKAYGIMDKIAHSGTLPESI